MGVTIQIYKVTIMNKQSVLAYVDKKYQKKTPPEFRVGDTVRVSVRISEGDASRVQAFEGIVIAFGGQGGSRTFTVRKISFGVGVERCFPLYSPTLDKIDVIRSGQSRRAKLYYLRNRIGRAAKLEEKESTTVSSPDAKKSTDQKQESPSQSEQELLAAAKK